MIRRFQRPIAAIVAGSLLFNILMSSLVLAEESPGISTDELIRSGIEGMFNEDCGGYCVIGACAHLNIRISASGGIIYETIISPLIQHAVPELVISAYNHIGDEPWNEWSDSVGRIMDEVNTEAVANIIGIGDGFKGGQQRAKEHGKHQAVIYKEIDIVGHPAAIVPQVATTEDIDTDELTDYEVPSVSGMPSQSDAQQADAESEDDSWSTETMLESSDGFVSVMSIFIERLGVLLEAFDIIRTIERILEFFDIFTDLLEFYNNAMMILETITRSTIFANLANPRFRATRLFCPSSVKPFQPYYLSYLDAMFWRTGYPLTDGPISGADHSSTILNPFSSDRLGYDGSLWGHLYPRDGSVNQHMDPKAATVLGVRALDVLVNDITSGSGYRVGVGLPSDFPSGGGAWQMMYPVQRSCRHSPFYPDDDAYSDFMEENVHGGYVWNYYHIYTCCMNQVGRLILQFEMPQPLCFDMPSVL
jgi:hypothetical protein